MKIRSIIIDDNPFIMDLLTDQLRQNHPEIELLTVAKNGNEGLEKIRSLKPDLIFLDVEMPDMTGFQMLSQLKDINFQTIFITSFSHYAINAIRFNALDYLLKPIDQKELTQAIKRFKTKDGLSVNKNHVQQALINLKTKRLEDQTLFLPTQKGELKLVLKSIIRIEGDRNYSYIYLSNKSKKLSSKTLGYFEEILSDKGFFRSHRSYLVNGFHIESIQKNDHFIMKDKTEVPISRRKKKEAQLWFNAKRKP